MSNIIKQIPTNEYRHDPATGRTQRKYYIVYTDGTDGFIWIDWEG